MSVSFESELACLLFTLLLLSAFLVYFSYTDCSLGYFVLLGVLTQGSYFDNHRDLDALN